MESLSVGGGNVPQEPVQLLILTHVKIVFYKEFLQEVDEEGD